VAPIRNPFLERWMGSTMVLFPAQMDEYGWRYEYFPINPLYFGVGEESGYDTKTRVQQSSLGTNTVTTNFLLMVKEVP